MKVCVSQSLECPGLHVWSPSLQGPLPSLPSWALHCAAPSGPNQGPFMSLDFQLGGPMGSAGRGGRRVRSGRVALVLSWLKVTPPPVALPTHPLSSTLVPSPRPESQTLWCPAPCRHHCKQALYSLLFGDLPSLYHLFPRPALIGPLSFPLLPTLFLSPPHLSPPSPPLPGRTCCCQFQGVRDANLGEKGREGRPRGSVRHRGDGKRGKRIWKNPQNHTLGTPFMGLEKYESRS